MGSIVLGRGEDEAESIEWLGVAATVPGFIGFAVGRSTFLQTIVDWRAGKTTREAGVQQVATKYLRWIRVFEEAKAS